VRREHRPYILKRLDQAFQAWYAEYFLRPHFEHLGRGGVYMKPWHVEVFGGPITLGDHAHVIAAPDKKVRLTVWSTLETGGRIAIGNCCLLCPGVRISAAREIVIGDSCMMAHGAYITDADWHDLYDRSDSTGAVAPVRIGNNAWIGDSAIVCKGVTIGDHSVVGAGAVVTRDVPPYAVVAGNPAAVVKELDPARPMRTRADWLADPEGLAEEFAILDRHYTRDNTWAGWIRSMLFPRKGD
jgi:acetyltransferase-like isoleucine patch superfamily enzyme